MSLLAKLGIVASSEETNPVDENVQPTLESQQLSEPTPDKLQHLGSRTKQSRTLPTRVIDLILRFSEPDTFPSLAVLNQAWHARAKTTSQLWNQVQRLHGELSEPNGEDPATEDAIEDLWESFAQDVCNNLYPAYRPRKATYKFTGVPSSTARVFDHGRHVNCTFSHNGSYLLWTVSMQLLLIDLRDAQPRVSHILSTKYVTRSAYIQDNAKVFAILSEGGQLDVYQANELGQYEIVYSELVDLAARAIALSPDGKLAAVACENSVQLHAMDANSMMPSRKVASCTADYISFSANGLVLLAGSRSSNESPLTIVQAPMDPPIGFDEEPERPLLDQLWMSSALFPVTCAGVTSATILSTDPVQCLAYDTNARRYGILDVEELKFNNSLLPISRDLSDEDILAAPLPSIDAEHSFCVIPSFKTGYSICSMGPLMDGSQEDTSILDRPSRQKQVSSDGSTIALKFRSDPDIGKSRSRSRRVFAVVNSCPDNPNDLEENETESKFGKIVVYDWDYHTFVDNIPDTSIDLSLAQQYVLPLQVPTEKTSSKSDRRPVNRPIPRVVTSASKRLRRASIEKAPYPDQVPPAPSVEQTEAQRHSTGSNLVGSLDVGLVDLQEPYTPNEPRSQDSLNRAATAAAANRRRTLYESSAEPRLRRGRGRGDLPDESDADAWVPPPPLYVEESDRQLPEDLRRALHSPGEPNSAVSSTSGPLSFDHLQNETKAQPSGHPIHNYQDRQNDAIYAPVDGANAVSPLGVSPLGDNDVANDQNQNVSAPNVVAGMWQPSVHATPRDNVMQDQPMGLQEATRPVERQPTLPVAPSTETSQPPPEPAPPKRRQGVRATLESARQSMFLPGSKAKKTLTEKLRSSSSQDKLRSFGSDGGTETPPRQKLSKPNISNEPTYVPQARTNTAPFDSPPHRTTRPRPVSMSWLPSPRQNMNGSSPDPSTGAFLPKPPRIPFERPESPALPRAEQISSLHKRTRSSSGLSLASDEGSIAPRAALGARRSPWSSSLMLAQAPDEYPEQGFAGSSTRRPRSVSDGLALYLPPSNRAMETSPSPINTRDQSATNSRPQSPLNRSSSDPQWSQQQVSPPAIANGERVPASNSWDSQGLSVTSEQAYDTGPAPRQPRTSSQMGQTKSRDSERRPFSSIIFPSRGRAKNNSEDRGAKRPMSTAQNNSYGSNEYPPTQDSPNNYNDQSGDMPPRRRNTIKRRQPAYRSKLDDVAEDNTNSLERKDSAKPKRSKSGKGCIVM